MASSNAKTVNAYIAELPPERATVIQTLRDKLVRAKPKGIVESMTWGMITYELPLETFPNTYNGQPLMYAALAAQKHHYALYLTPMYMSETNHKRVIDAYNKMDVKPNLGKSCIRFTNPNKIPLDVILDIFQSTTIDEFIDGYNKARKRS